MTHRNTTIDSMRGIAMIVVMLTHSLSLYLGPHGINVLWNYLHFVVPTFIFCSGYVARSSYEHSTEKHGIDRWYRKRFIRLYLPYCIYCLCYFFLYARVISGRFILESLALTGGVDIGWLTLLFLQLTILTPVFIRILRHRLLTRITLLLLLTATFLQFIQPVSSGWSRTLAWIPWSLIFAGGMVFGSPQAKQTIPVRKIFFWGVACTLLWYALNRYLLASGRPVTFTLHKYPPDMFYLVYAAAVNCFMLMAVRLLRGIVPSVYRIAGYFSRYSYEMFFIHLFLLQLFSGHRASLPVYAVTAGSIAGTCAVLWLGKMLFAFPKHDIPYINGK